MSAPSFDARGSQALSRDGLATPGESSGARELHTANRAVLMELLSLRQVRRAAWMPLMRVYGDGYQVFLSVNDATLRHVRRRTLRCGSA